MRELALEPARVASAFVERLPSSLTAADAMRFTSEEGAALLAWPLACRPPRSASGIASAPSPSPRYLFCTPVARNIALRRPMRRISTQGIK